MSQEKAKDTKGSDDTFQSFLAKLENDAGLREELRAAGFDAGMPADALIAFAAGKGYAFRIEDAGELSDRQLDAVAGGGDLEAMRLQAYMDRNSKFMESTSSIMKKMSDTSSGIISNLK